MAGGTPQQHFVFPHLSRWVRLGDKGIERSPFYTKIGKWKSVGGLPKSQKIKVLRIEPPIVENDATSGESILHTFLASQLPYNAKIQLLAETRPK